MRKIILVIAFMLAMSLTGCENGRRAIKTSSYGIYPDVTQFMEDGIPTDLYFYVVDNRTGVVYLATSEAITVMLNADGTPVTKDQVELDRRYDRND